MHLSQVLKRGNNNFDLLRLIAAFAVMFGHANFFRYTGRRPDPVASFTHFEYSGSLAVYAFFFISGMLISLSAERSESATRFVILRVSRIWPALIVNVILCVAVIGAIFTNMKVPEYFSHPLTLAFFWENLSLFWNIGFSLPGVFPDAPVPTLINPALWTLPMELYCYILVLVFSVFSLYKSKPIFIFAWSAACVAFFFSTAHPQYFAIYHPMVIKNGGYSFYPPVFFLAGMLCYRMRDSIAIRRSYAAVLVAAYLISKNTHFAQVFLYVGFGYAVLWLSACEIFRRFTPKHDYSYGVYIYGFTCQQIMLAVFPSMTGYANLLLATPLVLAVAAMSWHFVEMPAINFARKLSKNLKAKSDLHSTTARDTGEAGPTQPAL